MSKIENEALLQNLSEGDKDELVLRLWRDLQNERVHVKALEQRLAELFTAVPRLCAKAGLVRSGVVAVDGTKLSASANSDSNVDYDRVAGAMCLDRHFSSYWPALARFFSPPTTRSANINPTAWIRVGWLRSNYSMPPMRVCLLKW